MSARVYTVAVTTAGEAGSATGSADSVFIRGYVSSIYLDFHASAPATTDTTIAYKTRGGNILAVTNSATDVMAHPRASLVTNANAAITDGNDRFLVADKITVSLAGCDALTNAVVAYIMVDTIG